MAKKDTKKKQDNKTVVVVSVLWKRKKGKKVYRLATRHKVNKQRRRKQETDIRAKTKGRERGKQKAN